MKNVPKEPKNMKNTTAKFMYTQGSTKKIENSGYILIRHIITGAVKYVVNGEEKILFSGDTVILNSHDECEFYALEGVSQLMSTIEIVKTNLHPDLEIEGDILSMFDGRTNLSAQVVQEVKRYFGGKVYSTVIPRNVRLAEAPSYGLPITLYDPKSRGAEAYMEFSEEFIELEEE